MCTCLNISIIVICCTNVESMLGVLVGGVGDAGVGGGGVFRVNRWW